MVYLWGRQWSRGERHYELELGALTGVAEVEAFRGRNEELVAGAAT